MTLGSDARGIAAALKNVGEGASVKGKSLMGKEESSASG